ncbi:WxL domain-containing protein [Dellaglioa algida]|uniref:Cell surface protein n=1 Tax=Dellaglioa algida TaxID=105612 RepID=A0A5C6MC82_9LACO|nr:WxL domain-containing protein [Dellaglioa algida]MDK1716937.1 WxL domain-containing protein [Dellaglioa algida]MDK1719711.1 WxL domain-containing protein [Dellaglioa algida]MDK1721828.1 WxL domain-containing protein [Dellaglioa algida]MDK1723054.1 WxL domain-containing protein [Dellaglioa algida]MDK1724673.1 WxL domain-containing protein [Dellaglioa algida]
MRLNKNIRLALAIVPLFAVSIMGNSVANAAVATDGKSATTAANLTLLEKSGPVDPLDPSKPVQPINPGTPTPTTGDLRMDYISDFHFGSHEVSGSSQVYYADFDQVADLTGHRDPVTGGWVTDSLGSYREVPNYAQVTNNTGGNWELDVSNSQFIGLNSKKTLKGVSLRLKNLTSHNTDPNASLGTYGGVDLKGDGSSEPIVNTTGDSNAGTWTFSMGDMTPLRPDQKPDPALKGNMSVLLVVPGSTEKVAGETYVSTLNWTLTTAP